MKKYGVVIRAFCSMVVEAKNEEEAKDKAAEAIRMGDFETDEIEVEHELENEEQFKTYLRHANRSDVIE